MGRVKKLPYYEDVYGVHDQGEEHERHGDRCESDSDDADLTSNKQKAAIDRKKNLLSPRAIETDSELPGTNREESLVANDEGSKESIYRTRPREARLLAPRRYGMFSDSACFLHTGAEVMGDCSASRCSDDSENDSAAAKDNPGMMHSTDRGGLESLPMSQNCKRRSRQNVTAKHQNRNAERRRKRVSATRTELKKSTKPAKETMNERFRKYLAPLLNWRGDEVDANEGLVVVEQ